MMGTCSSVPRLGILYLGSRWVPLLGAAGCPLFAQTGCVCAFIPDDRQRDSRIFYNAASPVCPLSLTLSHSL